MSTELTCETRHLVRCYDDNLQWSQTCLPSFDNATFDKNLVLLTQNGSMGFLVWIGCPFFFLMHWAWLGLFFPFSSLSLSLSSPFLFLFFLSSLLPDRLPSTFEKLNHTKDKTLLYALVFQFCFLLRALKIILEFLLWFSVH